MDSSQTPPTVAPTAFPDQVEVTTLTSQISGPEAEHRRTLQKWTSLVLLIIVLAGSVATGYLVFETARAGNPEAQKLAFGLLGTILGVLWSNYAKLVDTVSRR